MEGIPYLMLWEQVVLLLGGGKPPPLPSPLPKPKSIEYVLLNVDYVPHTMTENTDIASLFVLEDNDAVIKMVVTTRAATMRHAARAHRIDLDWLFEQF